MSFCTQCGTKKQGFQKGFSERTGNPEIWDNCPNPQCRLSNNHVHVFRYTNLIDVVFGVKVCYCGRGNE